MSRFLLIGAAHIDWTAVLSGATDLGASNPARWSRKVGGACFNAAAVLSRLGHEVVLVSPRGGDEAGAVVGEAVEAAGVKDLPVTFLDRATPTYSAVIDSRGDLVIGLADMALYDVFGPKRMTSRALRTLVESADAVLTDANLPEATLAALAERCHGAARPLSAIAVSPAKVKRLRPAFGRLDMLFMNAGEAAALSGERQGWPQALIAAGLSRAVISSGGDPALCFDEAGCFSIVPPPVSNLADVTGAGDALAATTLSHRMAGRPLTAAVRHGLAAAAIVVGSPQTCPPELDASAITAKLSAVPHAEPWPLKPTAAPNEKATP